MRILVTGFDPFGEDITNPAIEAVKKLPDEIAGATITKLEIPTVFHKSAAVVKEALLKEEYDYVLSVGQAGGRFDLSFERVGINVDDARIPDNEGQQPIDVAIQEEGPAAYFAKLPVKAIVSAIREHDLPASVSNSAGTFVCNHILYQVLHLAATEFPNVKSGFVHVPFLPEQVVTRPNMPAMSLEDIVKGLTVALETIVAYDGKADEKQIGGTTH
ncbi:MULTISPECIES: pyroglutamyl-peptidase I [Enterococcus]|uniref:Pyrrolidone-carboxylate peptidase n=1 Tax=Enterococcus sulfureus ATCC 49903 TaxID=1140003 RepID=S0KZJ8_9ENTE|nr:pyroglutamyl-peptidase I [Enterococcus sulfureus]EOT45518.1 pyroglutamyl-peptidase I [Enterococcus sulfureus ATCC 49903]EOT83409.1 pyroglutamyl-peptidase I [Enterococcus sulfureus ATCC 49903]